MAKPSDKEIQRAATALKLNVPIRAARKQGRTIILTTRDGEHKWTPPKPKPKPKAKPKPKPPTPKPQASEPEAKTSKPEGDTSKD